MAKGGKASGKNTLMMKTATPPATRSTRSTTGQSKRKRALTNSSEQGGGVASKKKPHVSNSPEPSNDEADSEDAEGAAVQRSSRVAPVRPMFSSSQASDEDEAQASDGLISSDIEAGTLTAKQINAERPTLVQNRKPTNTRAANTVRVGKRAAQALDEVPSTVQPQSPIEGNSQDAELDNVQPSVSPDVLAPLPDTAMPGAPPVVLALVPDTALPGAPPQAVIPVPVLTPTVALPPAAVAPLFPQPVNVWLAATNLIVGEDGRLQQSSQSPEISKYISKTVRLASLNIFFVDAFPDPEKQSTWLSQSLVAVLRDQAKTERVAHEVNLRAQRDHRYMSALISMTTGRWCNARQLVIDHARALIESEGCSYEINGLEKTAAAARVQKLLDDEAFHFGKTNSGTPNKAAPYQHPEITSCISHFFKGRNSYGVAYSAQIHYGKYGAEMPQAMVALVTTAIQVALGEWKTGVQVKRPFTETDHRETYRDHVVVMQMVRDSEKGESKYARMLSRIYAQTMKCLNGDKSTSTSTASVPRKKLVIDIDTMEE